MNTCVMPGGGGACKGTPARPGHADSMSPATTQPSSHFFVNGGVVRCWLLFGNYNREANCDLYALLEDCSYHWLSVVDCVTRVLSLNF